MLDFPQEQQQNKTATATLIGAVKKLCGRRPNSKSKQIDKTTQKENQPRAENPKSDRNGDESGNPIECRTKIVKCNDKGANFFTGISAEASERDRGSECRAEKQLGKNRRKSPTLKHTL